MSSRRRTPVPATLAAAVLFAADRTCCVCRQPNRLLQLHHLNGDPAHHTFENLLALCLECHAQTQLRGGFCRQLSREQLVLFRVDWWHCVARQRHAASDILRAQQSLAVFLDHNRVIAERLHYETPPSPYQFDTNSQWLTDEGILMVCPSGYSQLHTLHQVLRKGNRLLEHVRDSSEGSHAGVCVPAPDQVRLLADGVVSLIASIEDMAGTMSSMLDNQLRGEKTGQEASGKSWT